MFVKTDHLLLFAETDRLMVSVLFHSIPGGMVKNNIRNSMRWWWSAGFSVSSWKKKKERGEQEFTCINNKNRHEDRQMTGSRSWAKDRVRDGTLVLFFRRQRMFLSSGSREQFVVRVLSQQEKHVSMQSMFEWHVCYDPRMQRVPHHTDM